MDDILRAFFGFRRRNEPPLPGQGPGNDMKQDPFFMPDGGRFFFSVPFFHGHHRNEDDGEGDEHHSFNPADRDVPFSGHGQGFPDFHESSEQMLHHFDDMFRSFDEVFRSMGMTDFPSHQLPSVPSIEQPPPESGSLRDHMLKQPDSDPPVPGKDNNAAESLPSQRTPSFFSRLWTPGGWSKQKPNSGTKADTDLDDQVKQGDLDVIFGNKKVQTEDMPPAMESYTPRVSKRASIRTFRSADGRTEEHYAFHDEKGNQKKTVRRTMGDQTHEVVTKVDGRSGEQEKKENFTNMDENDKCEFDQRWTSPPVRAPRKGKISEEGQLIKDMDTQTRSIFRNLFVFNFPGFPTGKSGPTDS